LLDVVVGEDIDRHQQKQGGGAVHPDVGDHDASVKGG
jgi:hypothetical protein